MSQVIRRDSYESHTSMRKHYSSIKYQQTKLMKRIIFLIIINLVISSCAEADKVIWYDADSYVFEYVQYDEIIVTKFSGGELRVEVIANDSYGAFSTSDAAYAKYQAKCDLYNDKGYKLEFWTLHEGMYENSIQDRDFTSIKVYGDGDDITSEYYIASRSPYKFIKSGYKDKHNLSYSEYPDYYQNYIDGVTRGIRFFVGEGIHPVYGVLSDLTEEDMILLGMGFRSASQFEIFTLYQINPDKKISAKTLTVELTDTEGNVLTANVENN